ncbi:phosphotransferase family protein [Leucobacter celer]|uniref:phosphotransferase family protein n=1 Tax=Leucobacter celer TaxID=668625 RepID=UPI0006A7D6C9|nr:phosphotransferase family protein [Leucobacter celer]
MTERGPDELFHRSRVAAFLEEHGIGRGPVDADRIGDGQSNVTFRVRGGGRDLVLRRGPRPPLPKSTHDMVREARLLRALAPSGVPVPEVLAVCEDPSVLGVPFYVMPYSAGEILTEDEPLPWRFPAVRRLVSEQVVDTLVGLHEVPVGSGPLAELGRPEGYLERQVRRFGALWEVNSRRDVPLVAELGAWLAARTPSPQRAGIVHGDYRLGNLMFGPAGLGDPRVTLVLDWEMATLGDPLADLGYLMATSAEHGRPGSVMQLSPVTALPGYLRRHELAERYATRTGLDLSGIDWYQVLALWKAAVFCEAIYSRWLAGERPGDTTFAPRLETGVLDLLEQAHALVSR